MNVEKIRADFPILSKKVRGKPIIYFDNSCVTLKPQQVIDAVVSYYTDYTACHGRSLHAFATETSKRFMDAHKKIADFINANHDEIVITKNSTEAINIVANGIKFDRGDNILTTSLEHNSNLLPWLKLQKHKGIKHIYVNVDSNGILDMEDFENKINRHTKMVAFVFTSNVTGTTIPSKEITKIAHDYGALVLLDAAQTVPHRPVDVKKIDCDFLVFSGHKMCGPSGIGALYGKRHLLEEMSQFIVGGETASDVTRDDWVVEEPPAKFEAGLQNYAGAIGFGAAVDYLSCIGMKNIHNYEEKLAKYLFESVKDLGLNIYGPLDPKKQAPLITFSAEGIDAHDIAIILDESANVFVRSGMHCTHYFHHAVLHESATIRASLYFYNTEEEIDVFVSALKEITSMLS